MLPVLEFVGRRELIAIGHLVLGRIEVRERIRSAQLTSNEFASNLLRVGDGIRAGEVTLGDARRRQLGRGRLRRR